MDQNNQFASSSTPKVATAIDEAFDRFLESKIFMNDPFIRSLINKCITLGFPWDYIKKAFHEYFEIYKKDLISVENKSNIDYEKLVDIDKFLERVIDVAMQNENIDASDKVNSNPDFDDGDDFADENKQTIEERMAMAVEDPLGIHGPSF